MTFPGFHDPYEPCVATDNKKDSSKSKPSKTTTRATSKSTPHASGKTVNKSNAKRGVSPRL